MAASETPKEFLEFYVRANDLINLDTLSLTDPQVYMYVATENVEAGWLLIGRTEEIKDDLFPVFKSTFVIPYMTECQCKFVCWDVDKQSEELADQELVGEATFTLSEILALPEHSQTRPLVLLEDTSLPRGNITITVRRIGEKINTQSSFDLLDALRRMRTGIPQSPLVSKNADKKKPKGKGFTGEDAVTWLCRQVPKMDNSRARAKDEMAFCVLVGFVQCAPPASEYQDNPTSFYSFNEYVLKPGLAKNCLKPIANTTDVLLPPEAATTQPQVCVLRAPEGMDDEALIRFAERVAGSTDSLPQVAAGTVDKLVERITLDVYPDIEMVNVFLLTYRSFLSPPQLATKLRERFNIQLPNAEKQKLIGIRTLNVVKQWVKQHSRDFVASPELAASIRQFLTVDVPGRNLTAMGNQILSSLEVSMNAADPTKATEPNTKPMRSTTSTSFAPTVLGSLPERSELTNGKRGSIALNAPIMPTGPLTGGITAILDVDPMEVARQICLIESTIFNRMQPAEFLDLGWSRKNKEQTSPNVLLMIEWFNHMSAVVRDSIVTTAAVETRVRLIEHWLKIAQWAQQYNNFNCMMEIVSGFESTPVHRLKRTWEAIAAKKKTQQLYERIVEAVSPSQNFKELRTALRGCHLPAVPYLGMFLTDLTFTVDGNPDKTQDGLVNFSKCYSVARLINDICHYGGSQYEFMGIPPIQDLFTTPPSKDLSEDDAYKNSLKVEPRSRPIPDVAVLAEENATLTQTVNDLGGKVSRLERQLAKANEDIATLSASVHQLLTFQSQQGLLRTGPAHTASSHHLNPNISASAQQPPAPPQQMSKVVVTNANILEAAARFRNHHDDDVGVNDDDDDDDDEDGSDDELLASHQVDRASVYKETKPMFIVSRQPTAAEEEQAFLAGTPPATPAAGDMAKGDMAKEGEKKPDAAAPASSSSSAPPTAAIAAGVAVGGVAVVAGAAVVASSSGTSPPKTSPAQQSDAPTLPPRRGTNGTPPGTPTSSSPAAKAAETGVNPAAPAPAAAAATPAPAAATPAPATSTPAATPAASTTPAPAAAPAATSTGTTAAAAPAATTAAASTPTAAAAAAAKPDPKAARYSGFLMKKSGGALKNWQRRYCVVTGENLMYYKQKTDTKPQGAVPVAGAVVATESGKPHCFSLSSGAGARVFHFQASNAEELKDWMKALEGAIGDSASTVDASAFVSVAGSDDEKD